MIRFKNDRFGICKVVAVYEDIALIKLEDNYEKYVVGFNLNIYSGKWNHGNYFKEFEDAISIFKELAEEI